MQIRNDFKNRRRPLTSVAAINLAKEKFGRKRPRDHVETEECEAVKRRKIEVLTLSVNYSGLCYHVWVFCSRCGILCILGTGAGQPTHQEVTSLPSRVSYVVFGRTWEVS